MDRGKGNVRYLAHRGSRVVQLQARLVYLYKHSLILKGNIFSQQIYGPGLSNVRLLMIFIIDDDYDDKEEEEKGKV